MVEAVLVLASSTPMSLLPPQLPTTTTSVKDLLLLHLYKLLFHQLVLSLRQSFTFLPTPSLLIKSITTPCTTSSCRLLMIRLLICLSAICLNNIMIINNTNNPPFFYLQIENSVSLFNSIAKEKIPKSMSNVAYANVII